MAASDAPPRIRRITPADGALLRDLRLRSLADSPDAFGQGLDEAAAQPDAEWMAQARVAAHGERRAWFVAERSDVPWHAGAGAGNRTVGIVLGRRRPPDQLLIFSMWVDPVARRAGLGSALIATAEAWASGWGGRNSVLWVFAGNEAAIRFYLRLGFVTQVAGDDARAGAAYGALAMTRPINAAPPG